MINGHIEVTGRGTPEEQDYLVIDTMTSDGVHTEHLRIAREAVVRDPSGADVYRLTGRNGEFAGFIPTNLDSVPAVRLCGNPSVIMTVGRTDVSQAPQSEPGDGTCDESAFRQAMVAEEAARATVDTSGWERPEFGRWLDETWNRALAWIARQGS